MSPTMRRADAEALLFDTVEVVDPATGAPAHEGDVGEMVITDFYRRANVDLFMIDYRGFGQSNDRNQGSYDRSSQGQGSHDRSQGQGSYQAQDRGYGGGMSSYNDRDRGYGERIGVHQHTLLDSFH
mgnify:CR=1 FL=1